ncbi:expressed unknown protein [Seminavis robusta]|uniref:Uncharacterized protein n=1 Tax=Seminavis robusta TaxID=568900 RepID=A0A9N8E9N6_9STRA|nr:expressed unknown protein [Seminavis robusta]|eukprot:Sro662_g183350.1 n/a (152) ;mRNA; r:20992-21447
MPALSQLQFWMNNLLSSRYYQLEEMEEQIVLTFLNVEASDLSVNVLNEPSGLGRILQVRGQRSTDHYFLLDDTVVDVNNLSVQLEDDGVLMVIAPVVHKKGPSSRAPIQAIHPIRTTHRRKHWFPKEEHRSCSTFMNAIQNTCNGTSNPKQ